MRLPVIYSATRFSLRRIPANQGVTAPDAARSEARDRRDPLSLVDGAGWAAEPAEKAGVFVSGHL